MQEVETVVFGPMLGELGWALSRWHGYCRYRRYTQFEHARCIAMDYDWRYPLYTDFVDEFIPVPKWVVDLNFEQDCYELVPPNSKPGGGTPQELYADIISEYAKHYDPKTSWTIRTPRGCNLFITFKCKQMWKPLEPSPEAEQYVGSLLDNNHKDVVVVSARGRKRTPERNVPEHVWKELMRKLLKFGFTVVITGTPHSSFLVDYIDRDVINMIHRQGVDGLDILIAFLRRARFSITSQSGPTHVSLQSETPSYIVGHEADRHSRNENYLNTMAMFREVPNSNYALTDTNVMMEDITELNRHIHQLEQGIDIAHRSCHEDAKMIMHNLLYNQDVQLYPMNVENLRKELTNAE